MSWLRRSFSSFSQRPLRALAIVISLGLITGAAVSTMILARSFNEQLTDIVKTYNVREQAYSALALLNETRSIQRGYVAGPKPELLELYKSKIADFDEALNTLEKLTEGNAHQQQAVTKIRDLVTAKQRAVETSIELARSGEQEKARASLESTIGHGRNDEINTVVNGFIQEEATQLFERNAAMESMRNLLTVASISSLGGALILAFVLASRTKRYVRKLTDVQASLLSEKTVLEDMVQERTAELQAAMQVATRERERVETLLQDADHRIGNSLATVSSLLGIQMRDVSSEEIRAALGAARDRIQTISSAHRRLRLGKDYETVRANEYLPEVIADIRTSNVQECDVDIVSSVAPIELNTRDATTLGIIIGELTMNALKHAFTGLKTGKISIDLKRDADSLLWLTVADTGVGYDKNPSKRPGLGILIVDQLSNQFGGTVNYAPNPAGGTIVTIGFPSLTETPAGEENSGNSPA